MQLIVLFRGELLHALVALDGLRALLRRQCRPLLDALLDALLSLRWQAGITGRQTDPVLVLFRIQLVPIRLQRGENGFLFGRQLRPGGALLFCVGSSHA